jgi:hypothetical protein
MFSQAGYEGTFDPATGKLTITAVPLPPAPPAPTVPVNGGSAGGYGQIYLPESAFTANPTADSVTIPVRRTGAAAIVTVRYQTVDGTAVAGRDYAAQSGLLVFGQGVTAQSITVPLLPGALAGRQFSIRLSSPNGGATFRLPGTATVNLGESPAVYQGYALWEYQQAGASFAAGNTIQGYLAYAYYWYFLSLSQSSSDPAAAQASLRQFYANLAIVYFLSYQAVGDLPSAYAWYQYLSGFAD